MPSEISLSIIIVNWKSAGFVKNCLASIFANVKDLDFEVLVIDNASFDDCEEIVRTQFPQVRFIQSGENVGFAAANNFAFSLSKGRNILFLNPDTEIIGEAIQEMLSFVDSTTEAGMVGARLLNPDLSIQVGCIKAFPSIVNQALSAEYLMVIFPKSRLWGMRPLFESQGRPAEVDVISGACMMTRRSIFEEVGLFSTDYFMYTEDVAFCYKVKQAGWKNYYVPTATVVHHGGGSTGARRENNFAAVMSRESLSRFMKLRKGKPYAIAYRIVMAVVAVCRMLLFGTVLLATIGRSRRSSLHEAFAKWVQVFRWAIGLERWVRGYPRVGRGRLIACSFQRR